MTTLREQYEVDCWGSMASGPDDASIALSGTPACQRLESTIKDLEDSLSRGCAQAKEAAHRGRVLPGILRELVAARGLEQCVAP